MDRGLIWTMGLDKVGTLTIKWAIFLFGALPFGIL